MGYVDYKKNETETESDNENQIEHFDQNNIRDVCHYACSSFSYINVIIVILILLLLYHIFTKDNSDKFAF